MFIDKSISGRKHNCYITISLWIWRHLATACWPGSMYLAKFSSCHTNCMLGKTSSGCENWSAMTVLLLWSGVWLSSVMWKESRMIHLLLAIFDFNISLLILIFFRGLRDFPLQFIQSLRYENIPIFFFKTVTNNWMSVLHTVSNVGSSYILQNYDSDSDLTCHIQVKQNRLRL